jgi:lipid-A-disaccharide synthase
MPRVLISAGEVSGDRLGAGLVRALAHVENLEFAGLAGPDMRRAGVEAIQQTEALNRMGFVEVVGALPRIQAILRRMKDALRDNVDLLVVVDAPDFNIRLAKAASKRGIPVLFLGSPKVWAWRQKRAKVIAELAAEVLCFFAFEPAHYEKHGGKATCIGHPIAAQFEALPPTPKGLAILPGSREQEIRKLLPPMGRVAAVWLGQHPDEQVHLALAPGLEPSDLPELPMPVQIHHSIEDALRESRVALVCSGTATLEVACLNRPQVVAYAMNPLSYFVAKNWARHITHIALPNLLTEPFLPEFVQDLDEAKILAALEEAGQPGAQEQGMLKVRAAVSGGGFDLAAERLLYWLNGAQRG